MRRAEAFKQAIKQKTVVAKSMKHPIEPNVYNVYMYYITIDKELYEHKKQLDLPAFALFVSELLGPQVQYHACFVALARYDRNLFYSIQLIGTQLATRT